MRTEVLAVSSSSGEVLDDSEKLGVRKEVINPQCTVSFAGGMRMACVEKTLQIRAGVEPGAREQSTNTSQYERRTS